MHPQIQIVDTKYCPILTNQKSMELLFIQFSDDIEISCSKIDTSGFVVQGHMF